jgi:hypothetical protein
MVVVVAATSAVMMNVRVGVGVMMMVMMVLMMTAVGVVTPVLAGIKVIKGVLPLELMKDTSRASLKGREGW